MGKMCLIAILKQDFVKMLGSVLALRRHYLELIAT